jgi:hypothetical protein
MTLAVRFMRRVYYQYLSLNTPYRTKPVKTDVVGHLNPTGNGVRDAVLDTMCRVNNFTRLYPVRRCALRVDGVTVLWDCF